ncbi:bifunctional 2',3'-cyclic-nucleotide 2'-phosphodiesterase/3'-nucleotidase [Ferrimonas aestuarii]|uniref:Bifunctional 2',3'-cyclic-nucleotide 2'-phosphodiesterase/3'-nucleotidase n=1 Tax=Ferrimonas aestuarii TaxID=2569539 RepID=A0A4U1BMQ6_9GAMM|nr:bifunctional 2',3'-cyclic-nucleotide 2'-phosphodiesterase/3'-nucleotidase [Ferrimonas aestuarii]TKB54207.1 bifunctional 2',3'-cyclic-nucleotide 2'-phosphodiesterase/3'-nucleotidase [Ferrimonas aestuarii]
MNKEFQLLSVKALPLILGTVLFGTGCSSSDDDQPSEQAQLANEVSGLIDTVNGHPQLTSEEKTWLDDQLDQLATQVDAGNTDGIRGQLTALIPLINGDAYADLRVMETTDIHANITDYNYYSDTIVPKFGLVRTASLIKGARAELSQPQNSVLVDNGDLIQGSPMGDYMAAKGITNGEVHPVYQAMNLLNYDVGNYGNHEFNYGLTFLAESVNDANFPYISANVFIDDGDDNPDNDQLKYDAYHLQTKTLVDRSGEAVEITLGYIGFVPPQIMQWDKNNLEGKVIAKDIKAMAERFVPEMIEAGADLIIAIPHSGISTEDYHQTKLAEHSSWYLSQVEGIDAILFGHSHLVFPSDHYADTEGADINAGTINGVPAVMPGYWGSHLGIIDFSLARYNDQWHTLMHKVSVPGVMNGDEPSVAADAQISHAVTLAHDATLEYVNQPIGQSDDDIYSFLALVQDDPSVQIVSDAQKAYVEALIATDEALKHLPVLSASAPFKACTRDGDCSDESSFVTVAKGALSFKAAADLYLYPNTLVALKVTGAELKEWLECSAGMFNQIDPHSDALQPLVAFDSFPTYNFDVIDGVNYHIDLSEPAKYANGCELINDDANRIKNLSFQGQQVSESQEFIIASNNYRANGGGNFPGTGADHVVINAPDANRDILANYIRIQSEANGSVSPSADNNWRFVPMNQEVKLSFRVPNTERVQRFVEAKAQYPLTLNGITNANERQYLMNLGN